jgi:hypothetical protein
MHMCVQINVRGRSALNRTFPIWRLGAPAIPVPLQSKPEAKAHSNTIRAAAHSHATGPDAEAHTHVRI